MHELWEGVCKRIETGMTTVRDAQAVRALVKERDDLITRAWELREQVKRLEDDLLVRDEITQSVEP